MKRVASLYLPLWSIDRVRQAERHRAPPPERGGTAVPGAELAALKRAGDAEQGGKSCDSPKNTGWRPGARWARSDAAATDARALAPPLAGVDEATGGADACWAGETRADVARRVAAMPAHQRPPMREMGRRSEAAEHPYKRLPGDDGGKSSGWREPAMAPSAAPAMTNVRFGGEGVRPHQQPQPQPRDPAAQMAAWNAMPSIRYPGDGPFPDKRAARERRPGSNDAGAAVKEVAAFFDTGRSTAGTVARVCPETRSSTSLDANAGDAVGSSASPLVTVRRSGNRVEVAAACPAARALGIEPGMALTQVRAATPDVAVRDADPAGDAAALELLAVALARRWSPVVAVSDADGLVIDLTGVAHLHGGEARLARRLIRLLARLGISARVAVADTAGAAWALARFAVQDGGTLVLPPGAGTAAIAPLPPAGLRLEPATVELLRGLGIDTVGALAALPRAPLARRFGRAVADRIDQATGRVAEPLHPVAVPEPIATEQRFAEPLLTAEPIAHWIGMLATRLCATLTATGRGARAVALTATRVDAAVQVMRIGCARATRDPAHLSRLLLRLVERIEPGFGVEALALHVTHDEPLAPQPLAGTLAGEEAPDLAPLVDTIASRIGARRLWRTAPEESEVPERCVARIAPLDTAAPPAARLRADDVRRLDMRAPDHPWHPRWPRPARLLRRPERVDNVMAGLPDQPPRRFTWRGETHLVVRGDGPERIAGEWWRRRGERDAVRDYFQVEDERGHRFWLFRRGDAQRAETGDLTWYLHGAFS